jgi:TPR repeat protein
MGVEADVQQGKDWLRQAAQQGVDAAKIRLAELGILTYKGQGSRPAAAT